MIGSGHWWFTTLRSVTALAAIGLALGARPCIAQDTASAPVRQDTSTVARGSAIAGIVKDSLGSPIAYATVYIDGGNGATTADDSGHFQLAGIPSGTTVFGVRRLGYAQLAFTMVMPTDTTVLVSIRMRQVVRRLTEVTVEEKRMSMSLYRTGFYDRKRVGFGHFLLASDIAERAPRRVEELLYGVPSVTVLSSNGRPPVAFGNSPKGGLCRLSIFVDGRRYRLGVDDELLVEANDLKGVEIYARATEVPAQFHDPDNPFCGAIVLWTRVD